MHTYTFCRFEPLEQFYTTYFGLSLNASAHPLYIKNFPNGNRRYQNYVDALMISTTMLQHF